MVALGGTNELYLQFDGHPVVHSEGDDDRTVAVIEYGLILV